MMREGMTDAERKKRREAWEAINWARTRGTAIRVYPGGVRASHRRISIGPQGENAGNGNGGTRGVVKGMSKKSRRRLRERTAAIPLERYAAAGKRSIRAKAFWFSPTYHEKWHQGPDMGRKLKEDIKAWHRRMERGLRCSVGVEWVLAIQEKRYIRTGEKVPHFHVVMVIAEERSKRAVKKLATDIWCDITEGTTQPGRDRRAYACLGDVVYQGNGGTGALRSYLLQYVTNQWSDMDNLAMGRRWGIMGDVSYEICGEVWLEPAQWEELLQHMKDAYPKNGYLQRYERSYSGFLSGEGGVIVWILQDKMGILLA